MYESSSEDEPNPSREHSRVTSYSRRDVLRILQISVHQLQGWERAGLIPQQQAYTFQDLGQLRTLRALRAEAVSAASIRHSILAMKAVADGQSAAGGARGAHGHADRVPARRVDGRSHTAAVAV